MTEVKKGAVQFDRLPFQIPKEDPLQNLKHIPSENELQPHEREQWGKAHHELRHHILSVVHQIPHDISLEPIPEIDSAARVTLYGDVPHSAFQEIIVAPSIKGEGYTPYGTEYDIREFHNTVREGGPHTFQSAILAASKQLDLIDPRIMNMAARIMIAQQTLTVEQTPRLLKKAVWELLQRGEIDVKDVGEVPENKLTTTTLVRFDTTIMKTIENIGKQQSLITVTDRDSTNEFTFCGLCGQGYKTVHSCKVGKEMFGKPFFNIDEDEL